MKKIFIALGISVALIFVYLVVLNVIEQNAMEQSLDPEVVCSEDTCEIYKTIGGTVEQIGVSDEINVFLTRYRWYGKINVVVGEDYAIEYLDWGIEIPMRVNETTFAIWHIVVLSLIMFLIIGAGIWDIIDYNKKNERRYIEQWQHTGR